MPMIDLTLPKGALDEATKDELVENLTATLLKWEGAPDNEVVRAISWVFVDEREAGGIYVGGKALGDAARYRVQITVPDGAFDGRDGDERRAGLVADVTAHVLAAEGVPNEPEHAMRVWVQLYELKDGNWGGAGRIFRFRDIAALVNGAGQPAKEAAAVGS